MRHVTADTPSYDQALCAYQRAFHRELTQIVDAITLTEVTRVLDVPCGNGFYARHFARRLGPTGSLDCVDLSLGYLTQTRRRLHGATCAWEVCRANAYRLPFADSRFDIVWCAQSLISLDDPIAGLREMTRVTRRGGRLVILENDIFHHIILPWPVDLEIPIERAIQRASTNRFGSSSKLAPARRVAQLLEKVGIARYRRTTFAADRQAPWSAEVRRFLRFHVDDLWRLVSEHLSAKDRAAFTRFTAGRGRQALFGNAMKDLTCLNVLYEARV